MKKQNFVSWYYGQGLKDFLEAEKNLLFFLWKHFSITDLTLTLFSPWKRDIAGHYWRGFQPLKTLETLINNLISRFIGGLVRLAVILTGVVVIIVFFIVFFIFLLFWIMPFLIFIFFVFPGISFITAGSFSLAIFLFYLCIVFKIYGHSGKIPYAEMSLSQIMRQKWFERVWTRMSGSRNNFDIALADDPEKFYSFLKLFGLNEKEFARILDWEIKVRQEKENKGIFWLKENLEKITPIGAQWKYAYTINLDKYSMELTLYNSTVHHHQKLIGRENELDLVNFIMSRPDQNNVLLVGSEGIGKTTLIHHLASLTRLNRSGSYLQNKRILVLDLGRVISEAMEEGRNVENELHLLFREAIIAGNVILVIENIENFLGEKDKITHFDVSIIMNEYLSYRNFRVLATSTNKEYHQLVEKHESFVKYFEVVEMKEPTEEEAVEILLNFFKDYEAKRVLFTYKALEHIVTLSGKYKWEVVLPERAIDLAEKVLNYWSSRSVSDSITPEVVDEFVTLETGTPQGMVKEEEKEKLLNLEEAIHRRIVGQKEAVRQLAEALRRARSGINDPRKPVGSFLFLGPTGVGKTETAKALAESYFGHEGKMIRLDMSEFQSPSSIDRLIGSSKLNQTGQLVNLIKDNPFSLLLLDELEKANPHILDLFLQVLDEGFITDAFGEKINFRNMIIIATSNAGSALIKKIIESGGDPQNLKDELIDYIVENGIFRVEFLNRFDGVIFFRALNNEELRQVVRLMLKKLVKRLNDEKNLEVSFEEDIIDEIIKHGYSPIFGARSLNRFIEDKVENAIARKIISGEVSKSESIIITTKDIE